MHLERLERRMLGMARAGCLALKAVTVVGVGPAGSVPVRVEQLEVRGGGSDLGWRSDYQ